MRKISSFALAFAFIVPLAGCPGDDSGETDTVGATSMMMTTAPATETAATDTPMTDTGMATVTPMTDTGMATADSSGGGGSGFCGQTCMAAADCVPPMGNEADWACTDGFCEYIAEIPACDPASCDDLMIGVCSEVDGVSICTTPCSDDTMCLAGFTECTGTDDAGNMICQALPCGGVAEGEPCDIPMFGQIGTCTDGVCTCTDDAECTAMGFACNN